MRRFVSVMVFPLMGLVVGCGVLPWVSIDKSGMDPGSWARLERRLEALDSGGVPRALHIEVLDTTEPVHVRMRVPMWMIRLVNVAGNWMVRWNPEAHCDAECRKALEMIPWALMNTRGTSIRVSTPREKVAIWVE